MDRNRRQTVTFSRTTRRRVCAARLPNGIFPDRSERDPPGGAIINHGQVSAMESPKRDPSRVKALKMCDSTRTKRNSRTRHAVKRSKRSDDRDESRNRLCRFTIFSVIPWWDVKFILHIEMYRIPRAFIIRTSDLCVALQQTTALFRRLCDLAWS